MPPKASTSELRERRRRMMSDEEDDMPYMAVEGADSDEDWPAARRPPPRPRSPTKPSAKARDPFKELRKLSPGKSGKRSAARATTPPPAPRLGSSPSGSSPSLTLKFAGKVYRTLDKSIEGVSYSAAGNFLGEPDEDVADLERERAERKRRELERVMLRESMSPEKHGSAIKRRRVVLDDSDDDGIKREDGGQLATPKKQLLPPAPVKPAPARPSPSELTPPRALKQPFALRPPSKPTSSPKLGSPTRTLPAPISALLALHAALEGALIMHLGMSGSFVASSSTEFDAKGRATVRIPNLITLTELGKMVRSSGGRECGQKEIEQLVWAWDGCGLDEDELIGDGDDEDDLRVVERGDDEVGGLGFIVSKTRVGRGNNIVWTHGLGITVTIKSNPQLPKYELVPHSPKRARQNEAQTPPASPSSIGRGRDGMHVVALWSQGKEARRKELTRRLRRWGRKCAREEQAQASPVYDPALAAFPVIFPPIPRAVLPSLALSQASPTLPGTSSPSPRKPRPPPSDVFGPAVAVSGEGKHSGAVMMLLEGKAPPESPTKTKASDRAKAMRERLAAKQADRSQPSTSHAFLEGGAFPTRKVSLKPEKTGAVTTGAQDMYAIEKEAYKRNAIVSRLGNVADVIMMVSLKSSGRPVLLSDAVHAVSASPLVKIGGDEAYESLQLLCELFPTFATIKTIERQDWLAVKKDAKPTEVKRRVAEELEQVRQRNGAYA